jgi:hypothetical protein
MTSYDFRTAVEYALSSYDAEDLIDGVKRAVHHELHELDPTASIESTAYYNHSVIPDFVVTWNESGRKYDRQVFLRPSILSATAGRDIEILGHSAPVLLALRSNFDPLAEESAVRHIANAPDVLLTDVNSIAQIAAEIDSRELSPLHSLVRSNLVRGGRGLIFSSEADRINSAIDYSSGDINELREFERIVDSLFLSDAAARLQRAARLLTVGVTGNLSLLRENDVRVASARDGKLSGAEVSALLPYLLGRTGITDDPAYWSYLGSILTLDLLEEMAHDLADLDLTPLVVPNLANWQAMKASVSLGSETYAPDARIISPYRWHFDAKMLSIVVGEWRIHVTPNGRRLRAQNRAAPVSWDEISEQLRGFQLSGVLLSGIQRQVHVSSDTDTDVYNDVQAIRQSVEDDFQVPQVTIRVHGEGSDTDVTVNFPAMLASANRAVSAAGLVKIVRGLLIRENR